MFLAPCKYPFAFLTLSLLLTSIGITPNCLLAADLPVTRVDAETDKCRNLKTQLVIKATIEARKDKNYAKGMDEVREGSTLRLVEPGDYGTIIISKNNVIVEGDPDSQTPGEIKAAFSISGKNCLIRGVHCTELKPTAPVKIIDSYIEQINIENNVEKGFAEIWASNCIIGICLIRGPQSYTKVTSSPKDPRKDRKSVV